MNLSNLNGLKNLDAHINKTNSDSNLIKKKEFFFDMDTI